MEEGACNRIVAEMDSSETKLGQGRKFDVHDHPTPLSVCRSAKKVNYSNGLELSIFLFRLGDLKTEQEPYNWWPQKCVFKVVSWVRTYFQIQELSFFAQHRAQVIFGTVLRMYYVGKVPS